MSSLSIIVVGDISADLLIKVPELPTADQKVNGEKLSLAPGGMAANVTVGLSRLGTKTRLLAAVGSDSVGATFIDMLIKEGVDIGFTHVFEGEDTFHCLVLLGADGEKALVRIPTAAYLPRPSDVKADALAGMDHLHTTFGDPALTVRSVNLACENGLTVSIDLERADIPEDVEILRAVLHQIDILFVNHSSRARLVQQLGTKILKGPRIVVTTLGSEGSIFDSEGTNIRQSGFKVRTLDTTGAGDAFAAAFLSYFLRSNNASRSLQFASAAAALSCMHFGAQTGLSSWSTIENFLNTHR